LNQTRTGLELDRMSHRQLICVYAVNTSTLLRYCGENPGCQDLAAPRNARDRLLGDVAVDLRGVVVFRLIRVFHKDTTSFHQSKKLWCPFSLAIIPIEQPLLANYIMTDSIELPVLTHLGHGRPSSRSSTRLPDVVVTSATMGYGASTTLGRVEAQDDTDLAQINTNDSAESDPLLLRRKIVSEGELSEIRK